ncbi:MAG: hypothetical protein CM1200mP39_15410 [Dehalococcoidia bacterium]|nr:MAG: hypothetical protein CM1200mP39_15410 [Dehalococcoidia bacterium]
MQFLFDSQGNLVEALRDSNASKSWNIGLGKYWFAGQEEAGDLVWLFFILDGFFRALGMMLLGVVLYRLNVIQGKLDSKIYRRMALFGLLDWIAHNAERYILDDFCRLQPRDSSRRWNTK